ncbi:MAG: hypothetical protein NC131_14050, partial [Roseburia sp.]|nr:hypothetical protein [Roseburia sp.]
NVTADEYDSLRVLLWAALGVDAVPEANKQTVIDQKIAEAAGVVTTEQANYDTAKVAYNAAWPEVEAAYTAIHAAYKDTQKVTVDGNAYEHHVPVAVSAQTYHTEDGKKVADTDATVHDYTLDIYRKSYATRLEKVEATMNGKTYEAVEAKAGEYLLVLPKAEYDAAIANGRYITRLTATASMPEFAYVEYVQTADNANINVNPGERLGDQTYSSYRLNEYDEKGIKGDNALKVRVKVYTDATSFVMTEYRLTILVEENPYYVYLNEDYLNPLPIRRVEDSDKGLAQYRYVGVLYDNDDVAKNVIPGTVTVIAAAAGSMVQVNNATGTSTVYKEGHSSETFRFAAAPVRDADGKVVESWTGVDAATRFFNDDGWNDIGFSVGTRAADSADINNIVKETVRIYYAPADAELEKLSITFDGHKGAPVEDMTFNRDIDADPDTLEGYEINAKYDAAEGIYYVVLTNVDEDYGWQIDMETLVSKTWDDDQADYGKEDTDRPTNIYYQIFSDANADGSYNENAKAEAEQLVKDIRNGLEVNNGTNMLEWTGQNSNHQVVLRNDSANTNFYIVVSPVSSQKYPSVVYTLRVEKLKPTIVAATSTGNALVRQVQVQTDEKDKDGNTIYEAVDFLYYEDATTSYSKYPEGFETNQYSIASKKEISDVIAALAGTDAAGNVKDLPTFVVKVRYPDANVAKTTTIKLTTENPMTTVALYSDATTYGSSVKSNAKDLTVTFPVSLADLTQGFGVYKFRAALSVDGQNAVPREYLVVLQYADTGTDLVSLKNYPDTGYSGDRQPIVIGGPLGTNPELYPIRKIDEGAMKGDYYMAVPRTVSDGAELYIEAAAGSIDKDGKINYSIRSNTNFAQLDASGRESLYIRSNADDKRTYLGRLAFKANAAQMNSDDGQIIYIKVTDEAGNWVRYTLHVYYQSAELGVEVRTGAVADGSPTLTAETFKDSSFGKVQDREYYTTLIPRNYTAMPFRITALSEYANILVPTTTVTLDDGITTKKVPYYFSVEESSIKAAMAGYEPNNTSWAANVAADGDPISDYPNDDPTNLPGVLDLTDEDLSRALETGIYVPFYVRAEDGLNTVLRLLKFRWSFADLSAEKLIADYDWAYTAADGTKGVDNFRNVEATKAKNTATQTFTLTIPSDQQTLDLTLTPELPVTKYILFDESEELVKDPSKLDYVTRTDYVRDAATGLYNKRTGISLVNSDGTPKDELKIYLYVPSGRYVPGEKPTDPMVEELDAIPVILKLERVSTDRTFKSVVANKDSKEYAHNALANTPEAGKYLTFVPDEVTTEGFTIADLTMTMTSAKAKIMVDGTDLDYVSGDTNGVYSIRRLFTKGNPDEYVTITKAEDANLDKDTKGFKLLAHVLSAYGQMRIAELEAAKGAPLTEAELAAAYNKYTLIHEIIVVPTDMDLEISVSYTRQAGTAMDLVRDENGVYNVFDFKTNATAQVFNVLSDRTSGVKLQLLDSDGNVVYDSETYTTVPINQILMQGSNALATKFVASTPDDAQTRYTIRVSSTKDGVRTASGTAFLNREFPLIIRPMSDDTSVTIWVEYDTTQADGTVRHDKVKAEWANGVFSAAIGIKTTDVKITIEGNNQYTKPALDLMGKNVGGTNPDVAGHDIYVNDNEQGAILKKYGYPMLMDYDKQGDKDPTWAAKWATRWDNMWKMADENFEASGNVFVAQLHGLTENWGNDDGKAAILMVQAKSQAGNVYQNNGTYGYTLQLNRLSDLAELTVYNRNKPETDPYYAARDESTETENILVLYLDAYTPGTSTTEATGDLNARAQLLVSKNAASMTWREGTTTRPSADFNQTLSTQPQEGNLDRGRYTVTVQAQDGIHTKVYTLIVKDKTTETRINLLANEDKSEEYRIYHDSAAGTTEQPYEGFVPTRASTLKFDPIDRNARITKVVQYKDASFSVAYPNDVAFRPADGTMEGVYPAIKGASGEYVYGAAEINTPAGKANEVLYYGVTVVSQATDVNGNPVKTSTYYVKLTRKNVSVDVEYVKAVVEGNETDSIVVPSDEDGLKRFNLNVAEANMTLNIQPKGDSGVAVKVTSFNNADVLHSPSEKDNLYTTPYTNVAPEGESAVVHFEVTDTDYYDVDDQGRVLTPNAKGTFAIAIFRSNHDTSIGRIFACEPGNEEHLIEAYPRPNNPTFYEVAVNPNSMDSIVVDGKVQIVVNATNAYTNMLEINPSNANFVSGSEVYNMSEEGTGKLVSKTGYSVTGSNGYTDMNFYVVSSSGVRQQWYTVRIYFDDQDTTLTRNKSIMVDDDDMTVTDAAKGITANAPTYTKIVGSREPVNLTVKPSTALTMVFIQDMDGNLVAAQRGGGVFQNLPISKLGENRYTIIVLSAIGYTALRESAGANLETKLDSMLKSGELKTWLETEGAVYPASRYTVVLDYFSRDDAGIAGVSAGATGNLSAAQL